MSEPQPSLAPLHPTILIGYGSYGRKVLHRLLIDAEGHGLLVWEDPPGAGSPSERRLKDLFLIHIPDRIEGEEIQSYMAKDLFRQILSATLDEAKLKKLVAGAKKRLLDEATRSTNAYRLRLGLDVIVVAQPTSVEILGTLERILPPTMQELASDVGLKQPGPGSARVNFLLAFDFENYWDESPSGRSIRRETANSIKRWEKRTQDELPSFGRIYMFDGRTRGGNRDETLRIEEVTLFLEFLLFSGMRDNPSLRSLYQQENEWSPPLGTVGIRLIERSQELLKRLVAAYFGLGWLGYMAGSEPRSQARAYLQTSFQEFQPASLDLADLRSELGQRLGTGISGIEADLSQLRVDDADWPRQFREQLAISTMRLKSSLASWAGERAQQMIENRFKSVPQRLQAAVTNALHHESTPSPLGVVIHELKELENSLRSEPPIPLASREDPAQDKDSLQPIDAIHREYHSFKQSQVNPNRLADWWLLLAMVVAVAWTPVVLEAIAELPPNSDTLPLWSAAYDLLTWMGKPLIIAPLVLLATWLVGKYLYHKNIQARIERGLLVFTHLDRGWVISRVRAVLYTSRFRTSLESYSEYVFANMVRRLRGVVLREVNRILEQLESRRRELDWLSGELRTFLISYGVDPDKPIGAWGAARQQNSGYHSSLEDATDFLRMLNINPPTIERFESTQSRLKPFSAWPQRYSHAFLYPVVFLEHLSREYEDAGKDENGLRAEQLRDALNRFSGFSCAMQWDAGEGPGMNVVESYCVMPEAWKALSGVESLLAREGITKSHVVPGSDPYRACLLQVQLRVSSERLRDAQKP